jgi:hypothetical protein
VQKLWEDTVAWASGTRLPSGERMIDQGWVQTNLHA